MNPNIIAGLWGLCGALPYATTRLATALWSTAETAPHQRKMAAALFLVAMFTGPALAGAAAPWIASRWAISLPTVSVGIGLVSNGLWPLLTDPKIIGPIVSNVLSSLGGWLLKAGGAAGRTHD